MFSPSLSLLLWIFLLLVCHVESRLVGGYWPAHTSSPNTARLSISLCMCVFNWICHSPSTSCLPEQCTSSDAIRKQSGRYKTKMIWKLVVSCEHYRSTHRLNWWLLDTTIWKDQHCYLPTEFWLSQTIIGPTSPIDRFTLLRPCQTYWAIDWHWATIAIITKVHWLTIKIFKCNKRLTPNWTLWP